MKTRWFNVLIMVVLLVGTVAMPMASRTVAAGAADGLDKVEPLVLQELNATGQTDYFVWMVEQADLSAAAQLHTKLEKNTYVFETLRATAERSQADLRRALDRQGVKYESFYIVNEILVRGGNQVLLTQLAARPDVAQITANHAFQLQEPFKNPNPPAKTEAIESNITFVKAPQVWAMGYTGQGTVMAGNDTGIQWDHPAIKNKYRGWNGSVADHNYNWWDATGTYPTVPADGFGHGTHTTGTMVGDDGLGNQIGVAPGAQTIHCKNMTDGGSGSDATFLTCFEWDLAPWNLNHQAPDPAKAPDAVNNSWGYWGGGQNQFRTAINNLQAAGTAVEVSAGNEGSSCTTLRSPGDYNEVLTTGSVNHANAYPGTMTGFSSRGPSSLDPSPTYYFPDITAPGENIRSSVPGSGYEGGWSGTSMAGPHATALVGLIWSACPSLKGMVGQTYDIIRATATPVTSYVGSCGGNYTTGPNNDWGYGTIDDLAAVQQAIAQCVGTGTLDGTVTDANTSLPIAGVAIAAVWSGGGTWSDTTDANGYYNMTVPIGFYDITASKFAYISQTVTGVEVFDGATTTQNFALVPAPSHTVSGTVKDLTTNAPLAATVEALSVPIAPVQTDPNTGFYSIVVPDGTYTFRASAPLHQPVDQQLVVDGNKTLNFLLPGLPCILLVDDDDNAPDVRSYFTAALDAMGLGYDVFDVGGGAGNGPDLAGMSGYKMIIWFSGDKFGSSAGPNGTDEANLTQYLTNGGRLFLSSQDYLYDWGLTTFGSAYLGVGTYTNDTGDATGQTGIAGDPIGGGLGPYSLTYPSGYYDYGDILNAGSGASNAFKATNNTNNLDIDKAGANWKTVFFATDWVAVYNNNAANGITVLQRIVDFFGGCVPPCDPPTNAAFTWTPPSPYVGDLVTFDGTAQGTAPITYAWTFGDGGTGTGQQVTHTYAAAGTYTVTMTASNACGQQVVEHSVTVTAPPTNVLHLNKAKMNKAAAARPGYYKIVYSGRVHDQNHQVVAGVLVTGVYTYPDGSLHTMTYTSDVLGRFKFPIKEQQVGVYQLCVTNMQKAGYAFNPNYGEWPLCMSVTVP